MTVHLRRTRRLASLVAPTTSALPAGIHLIRAAYLGTAGFLASNSVKVYQLVTAD